MLNLLGGLDRASGGQLLFGETDLAACEERALTLYRRRHVGFVFQAYNLLAGLTAGENVALGCLRCRTAARDLTEALSLVGIAELE